MAQVGIGDQLSPDEEAELQQEQRATYLAEAERAVEVIEEKIAGMRESLKAAKDEVKRLKGRD